MEAVTAVAAADAETVVADAAAVVVVIGRRGGDVAGVESGSADVDAGVGADAEELGEGESIGAVVGDPVVANADAGASA